MEVTRIRVCRDCLALLGRRPKRAATTRCSSLVQQQQQSRRKLSARAHNERVRANGYPTPASREQPVKILESLLVAARSAHTVSSQDLNALHNRIFELTNSALKPEDGKIPEEQRVLYVLEQLTTLTKRLIDGHAVENVKAEGAGKEASATSALLGSVNARSYPAFISKASILNQISEKAEEVLRHPHIFITPAILKEYVELQSLLHQPGSFPDIFDLYARKPVPLNSSSGVKYTDPEPNKINAAIPAETAKTALESAINAHNLSLAIDIIQTSYSTPAFKRSKVLRQAAPLLVGGGLAPFAAYILADRFSAIQSTMEPGYATGVAFAGIMTYVFAVGGMGYVAVTTANDQMDRVTWAQGVPLWERWVREEERAALDKVAGAWGFQGLERRGEEEGEEWESLKEFVGLKGMVLDRVELMDGME